jgi:hypothetical protein
MIYLKRFLKQIFNEKIRLSIYNLPEHVIKKLIIFSHRYNLNFIIYWIWSFNLKKINGISFNQKNKTIIVFNSPGGLDDLRAAYLNLTSNFNFVYIDGEIIKTSCNHILGPDIEDYNKGLFNVNKSDRLKYESFLKGLILNLANRFNLAGFINFNHVYYAQIDFAKVSVQMDLPFLTILKECLRTNAYNKSTEIIYRDRIRKVESTAIAVHNEDTKSVLINSGIIEGSKVIITGQGRSDFLLRKIFVNQSDQRVANKNILFFSISNTAGLPYFGSEYLNVDKSLPDGFNWDKMAKNVWKALVNYVNTRPNVRLIVKGKPTGVYSIDEIKSKNILVLHGNPSMELYNNADLVVGFNTTALVESIAANIPTITTNFFTEQEEENLVNILFQWGNIIDIARDEFQLASIMDNYLFNNYKKHIDIVEKEGVLKKYLGNSDGHAGDRIRDFINNFIK